jgi:hypothetical protein
VRDNLRDNSPIPARVPLGAVWVADQDNEALIKAMYRRLLDPARSSRRFNGCTSSKPVTASELSGVPAKLAIYRH